MTTLTMAPAIRFHLSLNVSNLERSVAFYQTLFNRAPAKLRGDYAKFELDDPPVVLSLEPTALGSGGALNHVGFRLPDSTGLVAMQRRLELAGIRSQREEGVECCYARQTKFWVTDPDNTLWEFYTFDGDIEHRGEGQKREEMAVPQAPPNGNGNGNGNGAKPATWQHILIEPVPEVVPLPDESVEEVVLRGSLNLPLTAEVQQRLVREARRVLKPGGRIFVHVLVADRPLASAPQLPGPAAAVRHVPLEAEPVRLLEAAGFERIRMLKFGGKPCFFQDAVEMRELQLEGWKAMGKGAVATVLYKGPFREVTDDAGTVYPRGQRVTVGAAQAEALTRSEAADLFTILKKDENTPGI